MTDWGGVGYAGVLAAVSFAGWVRSMKAARRSEDIATTKIRSAAQGYVELFGMTRALEGGALKAPLSGRSCVWWQYRIAESAEQSAAVIQVGESPQPFYIEDSTGRCLVQPKGAEMTPSDTKNWHSGNTPTLDDALHLLSVETARYYCSESVLLPNVRLYVLGEFKTVRKAPHALDRMRERLAGWLSDKKKRAILDVNRDGRIDDTEMEAARRAAMLDARREVGTEVSSEDRVVKPDDGRPFVIASRVKPTHVKERHIEAWAYLGTFFFALLIMVWKLAS